jgi:hypothetical protein
LTVIPSSAATAAAGACSSDGGKGGKRLTVTDFGGLARLQT